MVSTGSRLYLLLSSVRSYCFHLGWECLKGWRLNVNTVLRCDTGSTCVFFLQLMHCLGLTRKLVCIISLPTSQSPFYQDSINAGRIVKGLGSKPTSPIKPRGLQAFKRPIKMRAKNNIWAPKQWKKTTKAKLIKAQIKCLHNIPFCQLQYLLNLVFIKVSL